MKSQDRALVALLRRDFRAFLHKTFCVLNTGHTFDRNWHHAALSYALERVRKGRCRRLIINMPPRSLKSITASVAFPAFVLGHEPTRRIICVSYSVELAKKHSNDFRALIQSEEYQAIFPNARIGNFKNTENEIELTERGYRMATSVGGTLTGRGGDIIIIDDPIKPDEAPSEARRDTVNQWFSNTLLSRLDDKRTGAIVIVMQRIHMDDLTGFLLSNSDDWEVLCLPAIAEIESEIPIGPNRTYLRKAGEALSPREPVETLEVYKRQMGTDVFSAQFQQAPVPPGGAMIKRHWVNRFCELPPAAQQFLTLQSWDTANKGGPDNDWSVCTTWVMAKDRRAFLVDVVRQRVDYPSLKTQILVQASRWKPCRILIEEAGTGIALVQEMRRQLSGLIGIKPTTDKQSRMAVVSAKFEAGQVYLPQKAAWLSDYEAELFAFPGSRFDDQCDSTSQALSNDGIQTLIVTDELLARSRERPFRRFRKFE